MKKPDADLLKTRGLERRSSDSNSARGETNGTLEQTIEQWSLHAGADATPSITISPPKNGPVGFEEKLRAVAVTGKNGGGVFETVGVLGVGGMGEVRSARQASLARLVAVKKMKPGAARDENSRGRFVAEALVTGELEHPNIVPVYELAKTERDEPFYAMKRVRGVAWNEKIDSTSLRDNVEILLRVSDAIAFAHSRGVIHRDLKPHNVMLGEFNEVLVMDWGLSLRVGETIDEETAFAGTASYMAPEMARGDGDRIGMRTDVYLLGAILFQILTGERPHPGDTVMDCLVAAYTNELTPTSVTGEFFDVACRALATEPADRYADVVSFQEALRAALSHEQGRELAARARAMLEEPEAMAGYEGYQRALFGFEEVLALWPQSDEAIEGLAESRRRYAEAALAHEDLDLAASLLQDGGEDLEGLRMEVGAARRVRDSRRARIRWLSRAAVALVVAVVTVLLGAVVAVTREKNRVARAEARSSEQRNLALHAIDTLVTSVNEELEGRPAMADLQQALLDRAIDDLEQIAASQSEEARVDARLAVAHQSMARIYHGARKNEEAVSHQKQAVIIFEALEGAASGSKGRRDLAESLYLLADVTANYRMGDLGEARSLLHRALAMTEALAADSPESLEDLVLRAKVLRTLGDVAYDRGRYDEATEMYQNSARTAKEVVAVDPKQGDLEVDAEMRLGDVLFAVGKPDEAIRSYQRSHEIARTLSLKNPTDWRLRRRNGLAVYSIGDVLRREGRLDEARDRLDQARILQEELAAGDPGHGDYRRDLLATLLGSAQIEREQRGAAGALPRFEESLDLAEDILTLNPNNLQAQRDLFICCKEVGACLQELGRFDRARGVLQRGLAVCRLVLQAEPESVGAAADVVIALAFLADLEEQSGRLDLARRLYGEGLEILEMLKNRGVLEEESPYLFWIEELQSDYDRLVG